MLIISHPHGTGYVRALLQGCEGAGLPFRFHTTLDCRPGDWRCRLSPAGLRTELLKREFPISRDKIRTFPKSEYRRLFKEWWTVKNQRKGIIQSLPPKPIIREFDAHVARHIEKSPLYRQRAIAVYGYEDCSQLTFEAARRRGLKVCYEMPLPYWETSSSLLKEEGKRLPEWKPTLKEAVYTAEDLTRKRQELELADVVFCPSQFVLDSLPEAQRHKGCIAEFGSPEFSHLPPRNPPSPDQPLRVLFVGLMSQRKGLADLFAAMKQLQRSDVELVVAGQPVMDMEFYRGQYADFTLESPKSHREVLELMLRCDVLALPSLVEGRALVQQEAMSCGLPIIVTPNAGGEDLVVDRKTGILVPIRSPEKLAEAIAWCADNRDQLPLMSEQVQRKVADCTWDRYSRRILSAPRFQQVAEGSAH